MKRCWAFHASAIPAESPTVVDLRGVTWQRTGPRAWSSPDGERHESWLLREHGPVRCPMEATL